MPNYEYKCKNCGSTFTVIQSILARHKSKCPHCASEDTERIISRFNSGGTDDSCSSRGPFT